VNVAKPARLEAMSASGRSDTAMPDELGQVRRSVALLAGGGRVRAVALGPGDTFETLAEPSEAVIGVLPPIYPEWLGDRGFLLAHGCRFPYVVGEMARGIATAEMVIAAARAGLVGFFGSAGLRIPDIEPSLDRIQSALGPDARNWGANLIHSPQDSPAELAFADLALAKGVSAVSASAFMRLSPAVVLLSASGLTQEPTGAVRRPTRIFAKVSRAEVARQFLSPAPEPILRALVTEGRLTEREADLARRVPVAEDITVEADSGGHTDNRPLGVLLPLVKGVAADLTERHNYETAPRVGVGGGIGTPAALASAFAAGAAYVVTGSVNQSAVESGLSEDARQLLAQADMSDVAMAPAADMFELGVKVQVLKRGTLFAQRGHKLYEAYRRYPSLDDIPAEERRRLETDVLGASIEDVWAETKAYFARNAPADIKRAERDPKHKMALVFRWYLFMGAQWAREGEVARRADYQIWCGPAMGAFNDWVKGSFLEPVADRGVVQIALNLLEGGAHVTRAHQLRLAGVPAPQRAFSFVPRRLR
jgi:trans-AT polyketide synthase/acyltransferase/oxidoreductase domain-containing protein